MYLSKSDDISSSEARMAILNVTIAVSLTRCHARNFGTRHEHAELSGESLRCASKRIHDNNINITNFQLNSRSLLSCVFIGNSSARSRVTYRQCERCATCFAIAQSELRTKSFHFSRARHFNHLNEYITIPLFCILHFLLVDAPQPYSKM